MTRFTLLMLVVATATGCVPEDAKTAPAKVEAVAKADPPKKEPPPLPAPIPPAAVFNPPSPSDAGDDPRVAAAAAAGDTIAQSLAAIRRRLQDLKTAYETRAKTENDLMAVAEKMKPLIAAARTDCDAILRAAKDLQQELPYAQKGYEATAALYRERAEKYRDPDLKTVTIRMADEFKRQASDIPRRIELTASFVKQLAEVQGFLAETELCLKDTTAALKVLSAGPGVPSVSEDGRTFRRRLEEFLEVVTEYQAKLFLPAAQPQPKEPEPAPAPEPKSSPKSEPVQNRDAAQAETPPSPPVTQAPQAGLPPGFTGGIKNSPYPTTGADFSVRIDNPLIPRTGSFRTWTLKDRPSWVPVVQEENPVITPDKNQPVTGRPRR